MIKSFLFVSIFAIASSVLFAEESSLPPAASRIINGKSVFYASLNEAFEAASGTSIDLPDEISILADCILDNPIIIEENQHIRLVSEDKTVTVHRGTNLLEYPLFWIRGSNASFSLGKESMQGSIIVDGGYANGPQIKAKAPLVSVNGLYSKFVMHKNVTLQHNYSVTDTDGSRAYANGAGVLIRTYEGSLETSAEFIMKGGIIQGNCNDAQNVAAFGGGVLAASFGIFTMEGGIIRNNSATLAGGGVYVDADRASFRKTGGIIYGKNAPEGLRNIALIGTGNPKSYGHALIVNSIHFTSLGHYRDNTVEEDDYLSYSIPPSGNGVYGKGENWDTYTEEQRKRAAIILSFAAALSSVLFFLARKKSIRKKAALHPGIDAELSPREKEVFDMLLTGLSIKEIAHALQLSYSGVNFHIKNIYRKLNVKTQTELLVKFRKK